MARCTARARTGVQCGKHALKGSTVCRNHGALSPRGPSSPAWSHGRYSKALPPGDLAEQYREAQADPELLALTGECELLQARVNQLVADETPDWKEVRETIGLLQKVRYREQARRIAVRDYVPLATVLAFVEALRSLVCEYVRDQATLDAISRGLQTLTGGEHA